MKWFERKETGQGEARLDVNQWRLAALIIFKIFHLGKR